MNATLRNCVMPQTTFSLDGHPYYSGTPRSSLRTAQSSRNDTTSRLIPGLARFERRAGRVLLFDISIWNPQIRHIHNISGRLVEPANPHYAAWFLPSWML